MAKDYSSLSLQKLEAKQQEIVAQRASLKEEARAIQATLDGKQAEIAARRKLEGLGDPEKEALRQALGPSGVPSEEKVGTPGG